MAEKKTLSAREVIADIRVGMTDTQLMKKHLLSAKGLQSLKNKLLAAGFLTQAELDGKVVPTKAATPAVDKKAFARNIAVAVKAGLSDDEIMKKLGISASKMPGVLTSLIKAGYLAQEDLDRRAEEFEQTVELGTEVPIPTPVTKAVTGGGPVFKWLCPACKTPHPEEYAVCPQCGIIVEKYKAKFAKSEQAKEVAAKGVPEKVIENHQPQAAPRVDLKPVAKNAEVEEVPSELAEKLSRLKDALDSGILNQAEFDKKNEELMLQARTSEASDKLKGLLDAGIITDEEFEKKKADPLQYQAKLDKLQEALASGILSQEEFDRKKKELLGIRASSTPPKNRATPLSAAVESLPEQLKNIRNFSPGGILIIIASGLALLSLFLPWVEAGIMKFSGFQQQGFLLLAFYAYPLIQTLRKARLQKIYGAICGGLSVIVPIMFIGSKSITLFNTDINAAGMGLYLFTFCSVLLSVGIFLSVSEAKVPIQNDENHQRMPQDFVDSNKVEGKLPFEARSKAEIGDYYLTRFQTIERERINVFNIYAFLIGEIWYFYKGMWQKGLIYLGVGILLNILCEIIGIRSRSIGFYAVHGLVGWYANWDYYLYKLHGQRFLSSDWWWIFSIKSWGPLRSKWPFRCMKFPDSLERRLEYSAADGKIQQISSGVEKRDKQIGLVLMIIYIILLFMILLAFAMNPEGWIRG